MYTNIDELDLLNQPDEGDPLVLLYKYREELSEKYPTVEALLAHYRSVPSWEAVNTRLQKELDEKKRKEREASAT